MLADIPSYDPNTKITYYFLTKTEAACEAVDKFLGRELTWKGLPDGRFVTELEPMDHWNVGHSDIPDLDPFGNPDPDSDPDLDKIFAEMELPTHGH